MKQKIQTLLVQMNHGLVEREEAIKTALLTMLAGENLVLIGPPGTGKSMIARRVAEILETHQDAGYFEYLLTKFSTPEEIFGPLSITELKADRFKRNTTGYLPTVQIAFLDEIFKASSSILNSLLTILNERIFHNGSEPQKVPLLSLISASNELPTGEEELNALYDRFLVRSFVDYVREDNLHKLFEATTAAPSFQKLTQLDLSQIQQAAEAVTLSTEIIDAIRSIWAQHKTTFKEDRRENLSDRRLKKIIQLLRVSAVTNERQTVDLSDVMLLKNCLWNHYDNAEKVREIIIKALQRYNRQVPKNSDIISDSVPVPELEKIVPNSKTGQINAKEKGYKGQGTQNDPILIETAQDLMSLDSIGEKGYYFLQTTDIDCTQLSTWHDINLQGHYDGGGHFIQYKEVQEFSFFREDEDRELALFQNIQPKSSVKNLKLQCLRLAVNVENSDIENCFGRSLIINAVDCTITMCQTDVYLIKSLAKSCKVTACQAGSSLIGNRIMSLGSLRAEKCVIEDCVITACEAEDCLICTSATNCILTECKANDSLIFGKAESCTITRCQSGAGDSFIYESAINCLISDCFLTLNINEKTYSKNGVAASLKNSTIDKCFVTGEVDLKSISNTFHGITSYCQASTIQNCAMGEVKLKSGKWEGRIAYALYEDSILENNLSIDSNRANQNDLKQDGKSISATLFNQRTFETTLGWDFENIWKWDDQKNHPVLRSVGLSANDSTKTINVSTTPDMEDLLVQQLRANIWL